MQCDEAPYFHSRFETLLTELQDFSDKSCFMSNRVDRELVRNPSLERESQVGAVGSISCVVGPAKAWLRVIPSVLRQWVEPKWMTRGKKVQGDAAAWHASSAKSVMLMGKAC